MIVIPGNKIFVPINITANKFGRGIEFREGSPIKLLEYDKNPKDSSFSKIILNQEALDILHTINEPIAIISVGKQHIFVKMLLCFIM